MYVVTTPVGSLHQSGGAYSHSWRAPTGARDAYMDAAHLGSGEVGATPLPAVVCAASRAGAGGPGASLARYRSPAAVLEGQRRQRPDRESVSLLSDHARVPEDGRARELAHPSAHPVLVVR